MTVHELAYLVMSNRDGDWRVLAVCTNVKHAEIIARGHRSVSGDDVRVEQWRMNDQDDKGKELPGLVA